MGIAVVLVLFVINRIYAKHWNDGITVEIKASSNQVRQGEELVLTETVTNNNWLPIPMVSINFSLDRSIWLSCEEVNDVVSDQRYIKDVFALLFYQKITRKLPLVCTKRGAFDIYTVFLESTDIMFSKTLADKRFISEHITVYPAAVETWELDIAYNKVMGAVLTRQYAYDDPFEFRGIREYQTYDTLKSVNWTASAKTGELKVNIHDYTSNRQVLILLNLENEGILEHEELKEKSISMAGSMAERLIRQGVGVSLISNGRDTYTKKELVIHSGSDESHLDDIMLNLARVSLKEKQRDFELCIRENKALFSQEAVFLMISTSMRGALLDCFEEIMSGEGSGVWIYPFHSGMPQQTDLVRSFEVVPWEVNE